MGRRSRAEEEYEVNDVEDTITGSFGSRLCLVSSELALRKTASFSTRFTREAGVIDPGSRYHACIFLLALRDSISIFIDHNIQFSSPWNLIMSYLDI